MSRCQKSESANSNNKLDWVINMNGNVFRLGDYMVEAGLLTEAQLNLALDKQKGSTRKLGDIIVGMGMLTDIEVMKVLEKQINIPFVDFSDIIVDPVAARLVKEEMAREFCLIPIGFENEKLVVVMNDPMDYITIDEVSYATGKKILTRLGTRRQIQAAIDANFKKDQDLTLELETEKTASHVMVPSSIGQIKEEEIGSMEKLDNKTKQDPEPKAKIDEKPSESDFKPQFESSEDHVLDFTKEVKRYFTVIMLDHQSIRVRMPTKNAYTAILELRDRMLALKTLGTDDVSNLDEIYNLFSVILSNNLDQQEITSDYLSNMLDIEDVRLLYKAYRKFAGLESSSED